MKGLSFRIFGFPVTVQPAFLIIALVLGWGNTPAAWAIWVGVVFVAVLIHELGHAFAFRAFGQNASIVLHGFGGYTRGQGKPTKLYQDAIIAVAGPLAGFALGGLAVGVWTLMGSRGLVPSPLMTNAYHSIQFATFGWGVLNLVPMLPLDGGLLMRAGVRAVVRKPATAEISVRVVSLVLCVALGILVLAIYREGGILMLVLLGSFAFSNLRDIGTVRSVGRMQGVHERINAGDLDGALEAANETIARSEDASIKVSAMSLKTAILLGQGKHEDALRSLDASVGVLQQRNPHLPAQIPTGPVPPGGVGGNGGGAASFGERPGDIAVAEALAVESFPRGLMEQLTIALIASGRYEPGVQVGTLLFHRHGSPLGAYNTACGLARMGKRSEAIAWLGRAVEAGFSDADGASRDPDLANLAGSRELSALLDRMRTAARTPLPN